jgi:hypothetical protein
MDVTVEAGPLSAEHGQRRWSLMVGKRTVDICWLPPEKTGADAFVVMITALVSKRLTP